MQYQRLITAAGVVAIAVVGYYLYKHGELGNPQDMINEAVKDGKEAAKHAADAAAKPAAGGGGTPTASPKK